ncbi:MAG: DUF86 domain-containing protein [Anaerolineae bacterium]|nr:DUF86 domain-containing protein [Anaerolineae bacterium]
MAKDDIVYLKHMLDMAHKARDFAEGKKRADFNADEPLRLALAHLLQVIGEAARHISNAFQAEHSEIPWSSIIGMRHKVVHDYMNVDDNVVWKTILDDLPPLIELLETLIPPDDEASS